MANLMKAARLHVVGEAMKVEQVPVPRPSAHDVLIRVHACGIVPNLHNILSNWTTWFPERPLPPLPAAFGLDPTGEILEVGSHVHDWKPGERVYVNPGLYCGGCRACRSGDLINCKFYAFRGYFGFSQEALELYKNYPDGGLAQYMVAPQYGLVRLPNSVSYEQAARFGYLGTMYSAMQKVRVAPGKVILINGISGTLGIGGALLGLALGATRILGTGRNMALLERVKRLAPDRIEVFSNAQGEAIDGWARKLTDGAGVDVFIDALGPGAPHETMQQGMRSLKRGGRACNIGAIAGMVGLDLHSMMDEQLSMEGSAWFTAGQGQEMADMAAAGTLDLSVFEHVTFPLHEINQAISGINNRNGGFSNYVIKPQL